MGTDKNIKLHIVTDIKVLVYKNMTRLFLGGLKEGASRTELEREFGQFGQLREVWVARKPPGFGFILFEDARDADAALKEMNGQFICGGRIRVEYARDSGGGRNGGGGGGGGRGGGGGGGRIECRNCGRFGHISRECKKGTSQSYGYGGDNYDRGDSRGDYRGDHRGGDNRGDSRGDNRSDNRGDNRSDNRGDNRVYNGRMDRRSRSNDRERKPRRRRSPSRSRSRSKDRKGRQ